MAVMSDGPGAGRGPYRSAPDPYRRAPERPRAPDRMVEPAAPPLTQRLGVATHYAGAAVSLALVAGIAVWSYQLIMRDVNGIPVVRAMEGPMRVAPDNPGGELASHTGLAVNAIAAVGSAAPPEDVLTLAPAGAGLTDEDLEVALAPVDGDVTPLAEADDSLIPAASAGAAAAVGAAPVAAEAPEPGVAPLVADSPPVTAAPLPPAGAPAEMTAEQVLALADQIAAGVDPLTALAPGTETPVGLSVQGEAISDDAQFTVIPADVPGVAVSLRPVVRPGNRAVPVASATPAPVASTGAPTVSAALPAGTALVQFGAYESPEIAAQEWDRLAARLGGLLGDKTRVIQEATSGGRTFFRLRASGFADMADARRFCSAVIAEGAECIPAAEG